MHGHSHMAFRGGRGALALWVADLHPWWASAAQHARCEGQLQVHGAGRLEGNQQGVTSQEALGEEDIQAKWALLPRGATVV